MRNLRIILTLVIIASITLVVLPIDVLAQSATVIAPGKVALLSNDHNASISISAPEIGSFELDVSCSSGGILIFDSITEGTGPSGFTIITNLTGTDTASVSGFMSDTPITSTTTVANISFTAAGTPNTTINVSGTLHDADGVPISGVTFTGAPVEVTGGGTGLLRVLTSPAVQTRIFIDGIPRNGWGLDWVQMPAGMHYLFLSDVDGFNAPTQVDVTYYPGNGPVTWSLGDPIIIYPDTVTEVIANFSPAGGITWWMLVLTIVVTAVITSLILLLLSRKIRKPLWIRNELGYQSLETENIDLTSELERAKLETEETKRAWIEVQEAKLEAEEAKEAVMKAAEDAMAEAIEVKNRAKKELEKGKAMSQKATIARQLYQEAKSEAEEAKRAWGEARRAREAGRTDNRPRIEAQEAEARAEKLAMMMQPASVSETKDMVEVEFEGLKVTAQAIEKLEQILEKVGDKESAVRIVRSATSPDQFEMKVDKVSKNDYALKRSGNKILIFDQGLVSELDGISIGTREHSGSVQFTITRQPPLSIDFE